MKATDKIKKTLIFYHKNFKQIYIRYSKLSHIESDESAYEQLKKEILIFDAKRMADAERFLKTNDSLAAYLFQCSTSEKSLMKNYIESHCEIGDLYYNYNQFIRNYGKISKLESRYHWEYISLLAQRIYNNEYNEKKKIKYNLMIDSNELETLFLKKNYSELLNSYLEIKNELDIEMYRFLQMNYNDYIPNREVNAYRRFLEIKIRRILFTYEHLTLLLNSKCEKLKRIRKMI